MRTMKPHKPRTYSELQAILGAVIVAATSFVIGLLIGAVTCV